MKYKSSRTVERYFYMDVVPFVSSEQYPTCDFISTVLNISLQPFKEGTVRHSSPCVDLGILKIIAHT